MTEIIIRPARVEDAPGIARVHVDSWRTAYKGILPDEALANLSYEQREHLWAETLGHPERKSFGFVAEDEQGQIVGFVVGGPVRDTDPLYKGELYAIHLPYGRGRLCSAAEHYFSNRPQENQNIQRE
jgi:hypothetical protein